MWHLGCVYAGCLAALGHSVVAIDEDPEIVGALNEGRSPIQEPGLNDLLKSGLSSGLLRFSEDLEEVRKVDLVWLTIDTPVRADDSADLVPVVDTAHRLALLMQAGGVLVISSQVPLGTSREIYAYACRSRPDRQFQLAYSPENLRLGSAISSFRDAERHVVGASSEFAGDVVESAFKPAGIQVLRMSLESAELSKHALNTFLAMSVVFANELGRLAELAGADARDVAKALKSEGRIGPRSYLMPGGPIAGGTLARDIRFLTQLGETFGAELPLVTSLLPSNAIHRAWAPNTLSSLCGPEEGPILVFGLAYKRGSDTLRRSFGVEVAHEIAALGYETRVFDSLAESSTSIGDHVLRFVSLEEGLDGVSAVVVCADDLSTDRMLEVIGTSSSPPLIIDAVGILNNRPIPRNILVKSPGHGNEIK
jgi:UDPglucose 6-dehydrogenase